MKAKLYENEVLFLLSTGYTEKPEILQKTSSYYASLTFLHLLFKFVNHFEPRLDGKTPTDLSKHHSLQHLPKG